jgi:hypothetical protein
MVLRRLGGGMSTVNRRSRPEKPTTKVRLRKVYN